MKFSSALLIALPVILTSWTALAAPEPFRHSRGGRVPSRRDLGDLEPETLYARRACESHISDLFLSRFLLIAIASLGKTSVRFFFYIAASLNVIIYISSTFIEGL